MLSLTLSTEDNVNLNCYVKRNKTQTSVQIKYIEIINGLVMRMCVDL